jgi:predicted phosphoribosyltransferase
VPQNYIEKEIRRKQSEAKEQYHELRGGMQPYKVKGKIIILVDDGIATGATMHLAVDLLRKGKPKKIVAAIPIAPPETVEKFKEIADEVICIEQPVFFMAVGQGYRNFTQTQDEEVQSILKNE